jgi:hypothetical protein
MASLYKFREDRIQDVLLAFSHTHNPIRYSLTHGGRYLPYSQEEIARLKEEKAWAMARLVIDKIMRLPSIEFKSYRQ